MMKNTIKQLTLFITHSCEDDDHTHCRRHARMNIVHNYTHTPIPVKLPDDISKPELTSSSTGCVHSTPPVVGHKMMTMVMTVRRTEGEHTVNPLKRW